MTRKFQAHPNWEMLIIGMFSGVIAGLILLMFNGIDFLVGSIVLVIIIVFFYHIFVKGDEWSPKTDKNT